jgi:hypothetical protein
MRGTLPYPGISGGTAMVDDKDRERERSERERREGEEEPASDGATAAFPLSPENRSRR